MHISGAECLGLKPFPACSHFSFAGAALNCGRYMPLQANHSASCSVRLYFVAVYACAVYRGRTRHTPPCGHRRSKRITLTEHSWMQFHNLSAREIFNPKNSGTIAYANNAFAMASLLSRSSFSGFHCERMLSSTTWKPALLSSSVNTLFPSPLQP